MNYIHCLKIGFYLIFLFFLNSKFANCNNINTIDNISELKQESFSTYAGVEVGSKGVKLSVISTPKNRYIKLGYRILLDSFINTNFINLNNEAYTNTLQAYVNLFNYAKVSLKLGSNNIFTIISSGVKGQAIKEGKFYLVEKLVDSFKLKINEPNRVVDIVDVGTEAKLTHLGVVSQSKRFKSFLVDIGSGNSKGVYFKNENINDMNIFSLGWGTKNTSNAVDALTNGDTSIKKYIEKIDLVLKGPIEMELTKKINQAELFSGTESIYITGGICWALVTLFKTEDAINNGAANIKYEEALKFYEMIKYNYSELSLKNIEIKFAKNTNLVDRVRRDVAKVHKAFDQKSLIAGTALLLRIMRQFKSIYEEKEFLCITTAPTAWISAYVALKSK